MKKCWSILKNYQVHTFLMAALLIVSGFAFSIMMHDQVVGIEPTLRIWLLAAEFIVLQLTILVLAYAFGLILLQFVRMKVDPEAIEEATIECKCFLVMGIVSGVLFILEKALFL